MLKCNHCERYCPHTCSVFYEVNRRLLQGTIPSEYSTTSCSFSILTNAIALGSCDLANDRTKPSHADLESSFALLVCCTSKRRSQDYTNADGFWVLFRVRNLFGGAGLRPLTSFPQQ